MVSLPPCLVYLCPARPPVCVEDPLGVFCEGRGPAALCPVGHDRCVCRSGVSVRLRGGDPRASARHGRELRPRMLRLPGASRACVACARNMSLDYMR